MSHRVIQNPAKVKDLDELYDAFEVNKGTNVKYVIMSNNPQTYATTSGMTLQQKLFRKFFYENSGFIESEVKFVEVTNERVAARIGIESQDRVYIMQNKNVYGKLAGA